MMKLLATLTVLSVIIFGSLAQAQTLKNGIIRSNEEVSEREDGSGAFRTHCLESHINSDDPLVFPNRPNATHEHVFFGNPNVDAYIKVDKLRNANKSTCDGLIINQSAYWVPALYDVYGERIEYVEPLFYYKTGYHVPAKSIQPAPAGLRMIAGDANSKKPQGLHIAKFRCNSWQSNETFFSMGDPLDHVNYLPACDEDDLLEIRIVFPQCWDGRNLSSSDHKRHMAYPIAAKMPHTGTGSCPRSHPIAIPEISYNFAVYVTAETGPSDKWRFSSDMGASTIGGSSVHGDWMNGWDQDVMEMIVENCLNPAMECMVGLLGDRVRLQPIPLD